MYSPKDESRWSRSVDLVSPLCVVGAVLVLISLGAASPVPFWLWWSWVVLSAVAAVATLTAESSSWRLLCFALAVAFAPLVGGLGCIGRTLLPVAGARFVARWPWKRESVGLDAICLWPYAGSWIYREGMVTGLELDVLTMLLIVAVAVAGIARSAHAPKGENLFGRVVFTLVILAAACAATARPWWWAVALVSSVICLLLSVPVARSVRRGRRTRTVGAVLLAVAALLAGAFTL